MAENRQGKVNNFFRTVNNLNATTKVLLLVLYSFILVGITVAITNAFKNDRPFKGYETVTEDDNIYLSLRLSERRQLYREKEHGRYSFFLVIFKKPDITGEITIDRVEYTIYNEGEKLVFDEKVANSKLTNRYTYNFYADKRVADMLNGAPHTVYLKVLYNIKVEGETKIKELKIKETIDYQDPIDKNYQAYALGENGKIDTNFFSVTLKKSEPSNPDEYGRIKTEFRSKEKGLIKHVKYRSYVSVDNHETDTDQFISDYVTLVNFYGSFNPDTYYSTLNDFKAQAIPLKYNPKTLYINVEIEKYDGEIVEFAYKINLTDIPLEK